MNRSDHGCAQATPPCTPGVPKKQLIIQMAVGDSQVPNLATMAMARTESLPLVGPSVLPVYGLTPVTEPRSIFRPKV